jgi:aspartate racemase
MIRLSAEHTKRSHPGVDKAGLLATDGTLASRLYHESYGDHGIEIVAPAEETQRQVMDAIYRHIKRGDLETGGKLLHEAAQRLMDAGAQAVICGCTEVSLVLHDGELKAPVVDPLQVLAEKAVELARG